MLGMNDAALIGISTPLGSDNWLTAAIKIKDEDGIPYFPVIQIGLVCPTCLESGQVEIMEQCEHMRGITPPWKSESRAERIKKITSMLDDPARAIRENAGVATDSNKRIFNAINLDTWFKDIPTIETTQYPDKIYVTVDPDAGGEHSSSCAIVSGYRLKSLGSGYPHMTFVITGMETRSTNNHISQQALVMSHIRRLRSNPVFRNVPIIFIPEMGTGFQHTHLDQAVSEDQGCYTLYQNNGVIPGVRKDEYLTQSYAMATIDAVETLSFILEENWVSVHGFKGTRHNLIEEFKGQFGRYGFDEKGKLGGKFGGKFKDDLMIAFMMAVYWSRILEQPFGNPYQQFLESINRHQKMIKQYRIQFKPIPSMTRSSLLPTENLKKRDLEKKETEKVKNRLKRKERTLDYVDDYN